MALMKKLYSLPETQELMDYFGDWVAWDGVLELYAKTAENPSTSHFLIAKGAILKVVNKRDLIVHIVDGWRCELDSRVLFDNGICYSPTPENSEEQ